MRGPIKVIIQHTHFAGKDNYLLVSLINAAGIAIKGKWSFSTGSRLTPNDVVNICDEYETEINYIQSK